MLAQCERGATRGRQERKATHIGVFSPGAQTPNMYQVQVSSAVNMDKERQHIALIESTTHKDCAYFLADAQPRL